MAIHKAEVKFIKARGDEEGNLPQALLLSPVDLQAPNVHIPMVFSFHKAPPEAETQMEKGLALALSQYIELSGRFGTDDQTGRICIHLNNEGVPLVLAKCSAEEMDQYLALRKHDNLLDLLPSSCVADSYNSKELLQLPYLVQITRFACGGLTLGIERLHRVVDGTGNAGFLVDWSMSTRLGKPFTTAPVLHDRSHMMPRQPPSPEYKHPEYAPNALNFKQVPRESTTTLSITFDKDKLASIKSECGNEYTTYVSLSAHLWRSITRARGLHRDTVTKLAFPVDGRKALGAPKGFFGNAVFRGLTTCTVGELLDKSIKHAASLIYEAIRITSNEPRLRSAIDYLDVAQRSKTSGALASSGLAEIVLSLGSDVLSTTWSRFPLYDQDFGFGCPVSLSTTAVWIEGTLAVAPTSRKDGSLEVFFVVMKDQVDLLVSLL